jgi:hypothetical protein
MEAYQSEIPGTRAYNQKAVRLGLKPTSKLRRKQLS